MSSSLAYKLLSEGLLWLSGAVVSVRAASQVQLGSLAQAMDSCMCHGIISSCQSDCKALLDTSLTHVRSAVASTSTFTLTFFTSVITGQGRSQEFTTGNKRWGLGDGSPQRGPGAEPP